jgi:RNA polymerase sigma factor (sigma-70 family)
MAPVAANAPVDLDLPGEVELLARAREPGHPQAVNALLLPHLGWAYRRVAKLARQVGLPADLVADAQQEVWMALTRAVIRYTPQPSEAPCRCALRTFLSKVVTDRLLDFVRQYRRDARHYDRAVRVEDALESRVPQTHSAHALPVQLPSEGSDPVLAAERREQEALMAWACRHLEESERCLLESLDAGAPLKRVAQDMGVSRRTVIRRRRKLLAKLRARLRAVGG